MLELKEELDTNIYIKQSALIRLENIGKIYKFDKQGIEALKNINLEIYQGEFLAIMGPSGSGKSTLMNIIGCLDTPTYGKYYFKEKEIHTLTSNQLSEIRNRQIGFVFQNFNLLTRFSARKNVEIPLIYARRSNKSELAMKALQLLGLGDRAEHKPNELSGGERQRVAIARALVNKPYIILADEPTGNLDTIAGEEIMAIFQELNKYGITIVVVTHEEFIALHARRIIKLKDGEIKENLKVPAPVKAVKELEKYNRSCPALYIEFLAD